MIKTPYNTLNISINELDENKDEKIFRKFIKMIEWIEDEKIRQRNYKKEDNLNYEERKEKHIQNQEIYKKLLQMQKECIEAYKKIATEVKRKQYEEEKKEQTNIKEKYKIKENPESEEKNIDAYSNLGLKNRINEIKRKEEIDIYDDKIKEKYEMKLDDIENETYKIIQDLDSILINEIHTENTRVQALEKVINQHINKLEKTIKEEEEIIKSYTLIANNERRKHYELERNTYEINLGLISENIEIEEYKSKSIKLKQENKTMVELIPKARIWYNRGIEETKSKLIEYVIKRYKKETDKEGNEFWQFTGQNIIYTENDLKMMTELMPEIENYIAKYLLSSENIEKSKNQGNYVGLIYLKDNQFKIVKEKSAERIAKKVERIRNKNKEKENINEGNEEEPRID